MRDLGMAFEALVRSTDDLHERFGTRQTVDEAVEIFEEETDELVAAALWTITGGVHTQAERAAALAEMVDVIVTVLGIARAMRIKPGELADALLTVAKKNDAKTHDTYAINAAGKIARKGEQA